MSTDLRAVVRVFGGLVAAVLIIAAPADGAVDRWSSEGPIGGGVAFLVHTPSDPSIVYAGAGDSGLLKSTDGGRTWGEPVLAEGGVSEVVVDPRTPTTLYSTGVGAVPRKSIDGGRSWAYLPHLPQHHLQGVPVLAIDPNAPGTLYVGTDLGIVFKSVDGGQWETVATFGDHEVTALEVSPAADGSIYAGLGGDGSFRSTDGGRTWAHTGIPSPRVWDFEIDAMEPGTVYAGGADGRIYKSIDAGATWRGLTALPQAFDVTQLAVSPRTAGLLYARSAGEIWSSSDDGATWTDLQEPPQNYVSGFSMDPADDQTLLVPSSAIGVERTGDGGATWVPSNAGLKAMHITALAVSAQNSEIVYAGGVHNGVLKSTDSGGSWEALDGPNEWIGSLAVDPTDPDTVYAGTSAAVWKSVDGGRSWTRSTTDPDGIQAIQSLVVDPTSPATVYGGSHDGVFKSIDGGATWTRFGSETNGFLTDLALDPSLPANLYYGSYVEGLFRSTDGAATWHAIGGEHLRDYVPAVAVDSQTPGVVYVTTDRYMFLSVDSGVNWIPLTPPPGIVHDLVADPRIPGVVYAGGKAPDPYLRGNGAVYYSTTYGATWLPLGDELNTWTVDQIAVGDSGSVIHAATHNGVHEYEPSGPLPPTPPVGKTSGPPAPGMVSAKVAARGKSHGTKTVFKSLKVSRIPSGASVEVRCSGRTRCPAASALAVSPDGRADGLSMLRKPARKHGLVLRKGSTLEVWVTKPNAIGQVVAYAVRPDRFPKPKRLCVAPGSATTVNCVG